MFTKTRIAVVVLVVVAMALEWQVARAWGGAMTAHYFHGLCNGGVGWPYADFIHRLRVLSDSGDSQRLNQALQAADKRSNDIFKVWLYDHQNAYRDSLHEILP